MFNLINNFWASDPAEMPDAEPPRTRAARWHRGSAGPQRPVIAARAPRHRGAAPANPRFQRTKPAANRFPAVTSRTHTPSTEAHSPPATQGLF